VENRRIARILCVLLSALFVVSMVSVSFAADNSFKKYGVRIRGIYVMPNEHFDGAFQQLLGSVGSGKAVIDDAVAPELDLEYFITKNISAELVLALTKHDIMVADGGLNAGSVWLLPPSLLVKYHFLPDAKISPYVGFGMNVVMPFDEKLSASVNGAYTSVGDFKVDSSVGWVAQVGADIPIMKNVYLNVDAKYYNTETKMTALGNKYNLDINPVILGTGIGVRF
jgi:outer membrane protein